MQFLAVAPQLHGICRHVSAVPLQQRRLPFASSMHFQRWLGSFARTYEVLGIRLFDVSLAAQQGMW
jgi:hypothetical protein